MQIRNDSNEYYNEINLQPATRTTASLRVTDNELYIGAGFLALNAFNLSDNATNRDVGLVILGSLYPTTCDIKLWFSLYVGG